jgi:alpha-ketoglutarate-dependent taurine dioxygenase
MTVGPRHRQARTGVTQRKEQPVTLYSVNQPGSVVIEEGWHQLALPALIRAASEVDLAGWISRNYAVVDNLALTAGAVLMRGFDVHGPADFRAVMDAISPDVLTYGERSSPRSEVSSGVYTSTDYPKDEHILLHNEQSYTAHWPLRIVFTCAEAASSGGRTPLADSRKILGRLSPATVKKFEERGILYVRNYLPGVGLSWQVAFQTERKEDVESYCAASDITAEWVDGTHLRTSQVRPAIRCHPTTGERSWFNHGLFFHVSSLPQEVSEGLLMLLPEADLPSNTYYGDGSAIETDTLAEIRAAYDAETVGFDWEPGDVLLVENMITAHGREPFEGQRRVLVSMSDPIAEGA